MNRKLCILHYYQVAYPHYYVLVEFRCLMDVSFPVCEWCSALIGMRHLWSNLLKYNGFMSPVWRLNHIFILLSNWYQTLQMVIGNHSSIKILLILLFANSANITSEIVSSVSDMVHSGWGLPGCYSYSWAHFFCRKIDEQLGKPSDKIT